MPLFKQQQLLIVSQPLQRHSVGESVRMSSKQWRRLAAKRAHIRQEVERREDSLTEQLPNEKVLQDFVLLLVLSSSDREVEQSNNP
ncbi:hypothetical protein V493_02485 [Pseudogymnoascus sp. VKM F-4281 (FW-2241)]|nr:hypothetical protein V493_02485 [Pseudogymnoascus sp. VKM F-4281 (FW-2241)]